MGIITPEDAGRGATGPGGAYLVWPAGADGQLIKPPPRGDDVPGPHFPNPADRNATEIYFGLLDLADGPPQEQVELQMEIEAVLRVVARVYLNGPGARPDAFRCYYIRLFHLARVGLEGARAAPDVARTALKAVVADLVDDEAGNVKNAHLKTLGGFAVLYSLPFLCLYVAASLVSMGWFLETLRALRIDPLWVASFSLLWVGCFSGVWLSYGIRKERIGLADMVRTDEDRLLPQIRLIFAGLLTCAIGLMFALGFIDVKLGTISLTRVAEMPMLAFLVGMFFGIGELALPASIGTKAGKLTSTVS